MTTLNKDGLIREVSSETGLSIAQSKQAVDAMVAKMTDALVEGRSVVIPGFMTFAPAERAARVARDPRTGNPINVPAKKTAKAKLSAALKRLLNGE